MLITTDLLRKRERIKGWYDHLLPRISSMVIRGGGDSDDGVDLFQDALTILYQKASEQSFAINCSIEAYIFGVCRKLWLMRLRRKGIEKRYLDNEIATAKEDMETEGSLNLLQKELLYEKGFESLGDKCRELLRLFYLKKSFKEITSILNLSSESYAKKLKFQCKKQLIEIIRKDPTYHEVMEK